jgi:hypothetical protein
MFLKLQKMNSLKSIKVISFIISNCLIITSCGKNKFNACDLATDHKFFNSKKETVCGIVKGYNFSENNEQYYLTLGDEEHGCYTVYIKSDRDKNNFSYPLGELIGENICVNGVIKSQNNYFIFFTEIYSDNQIERKK